MPKGKGYDGKATPKASMSTSGKMGQPSPGKGESKGGGTKRPTAGNHPAGVGHRWG